MAKSASLAKGSTTSPIIVSSPQPATILVKLRALMCAPEIDAIEKYLPPDGWAAVEKLAPKCSFQRLFQKLTPNQLNEMFKRALACNSSYKDPNFQTYYRLNCPAGCELEAVVNQLKKLEKDVEHAYACAGVVDTAGPVGNNPRLNFQGYLNAAPAGIDAIYAWLLAGGDGAGQAIIDLEQGWTLDHEDLVKHQAQVLYGQIKDDSRAHGTSVLGVICAVNNDKGGVGVAHNLAAVNVVSHSGNSSTIAEAIAVAAESLSQRGVGGVLLLEAALKWNGGPSVPVETDPTVFKAIEQATHLGVVVIEAAGNGNQLLDTTPDVNGRFVMNPNSGDFSDSGAIMVGSGRRNPPNDPRVWNRRIGSNYGQRVNCFAWGDSVDTSSSNPQGASAYTHAFDGTSSAAAIVAGAALSIQGMLQGQGRPRLTPAELRRRLSDPSDILPNLANTPTERPAEDLIGVMPNLKAISIALQIPPPPPT